MTDTRALVTGWFSFPQMGATAGDLLAADLVTKWLEQARYMVDRAVAKPFVGGVDWSSADPADYGVVVFVCGPFGDGWPATDLLDHFAGTRLVGVDLTMLQPLHEWNPFDVLIERDSDRTGNPDIVFASPPPVPPVVGVVRVHPQEEYGDRGRHGEIDEVIDRMLLRLGAACVPIDTRLDENATGLRTPEQVESLIARMDLVVTTRLHGLVLALKNGVPALALDPVTGGGKVQRQAETLGWPHVYVPEEANEEQLLRSALDLLQPEARCTARECAVDAVTRVEQIRRTFIAELRG